MQRPNNFIRHIPQGALLIFLITVYLSSIAPGLTWANFGADGGDLITAAATGGIAHPTGYPLYLLLARLFQFIPLGSLAFRTNLLSAFSTVGAALLTYRLVTQSLSPSEPDQYWKAGLVSGIAFGLAPMIWSQAVITEVYGLHSFLMVLLLYLSAHPLSAQFTQKRQDCLLGLTFGLAMGNHVTIILFLPIVLFSITLQKPVKGMGNKKLFNFQLDGRTLLRRCLWVGFGLLVYVTLPLRAIAHPPVNWGNPVTLNGFTWLVSGKLYEGLLLNLDFMSVLKRLQTTVALFLTQFGVIGLSVGLIGLIVYFKPIRLYINMLWIAITSVAFAIGYATTDAFVYLIPAFLCFAIWMGIGLGRMMDSAYRRLQNIGGMIGSILILALLINAWGQRAHVDARGDLRAESFGKSVLFLAPTNAFVLAQGDEAVFTLWYFHYALHNRLDLVVIANDLIQFEWYVQTLHTVYPDLNLPGPLPFPETVVAANPERPLCYVQYVQAPEISCLPSRHSQTP
jgi:hypothetical protein